MQQKRNFHIDKMFFVKLFFLAALFLKHIVYDFSSMLLCRKWLLQIYRDITAADKHSIFIHSLYSILRSIETSKLQGDASRIQI